EAVQKIAEQVDISVVTIGKRGALVGKGEEVMAVPASGGDPVDTTGAGDNFAAGFLYGLSVNASLEQSARAGALLAGHVIETVGPQIPGDRWDQIRLKMKEIIVRQP
ncbi:MAG: PfkB family carbohydrate kinase, partial [Tannerella sp.]|nr:PfkB family carbohydrate kinase [Tannerella sp.]